MFRITRTNQEEYTVMFLPFFAFFQKLFKFGRKGRKVRFKLTARIGNPDQKAPHRSDCAWGAAARTPLSSSGSAEVPAARAGRSGPVARVALAYLWSYSKGGRIVV